MRLMKPFLEKMMASWKSRELNKSSLMEQALYFQMLMIKDFPGMQLKRTLLTNPMLSLCSLMDLVMKEKVLRLNRLKEDLLNLEMLMDWQKMVASKTS
jgi:hypothetical protein